MDKEAVAAPEPAPAKAREKVAPSKQARPEKPKVRTPHEWARELGHVKGRRLEITLNGHAPGARFSSAHRAAATWFGWDEGARRGDPPVSLTKEQYLEALKAAAVFGECPAALAPCRQKKAKS